MPRGDRGEVFKNLRLDREILISSLDGEVDVVQALD